ncbi:MAG: hypothetical protein M3N49_08830 [Candidatus Eremiobacteraeota bacterium]|nr:hypothetical protein [Candidatus Eremiobacteraeota bacterium]
MLVLAGAFAFSPPARADEPVVPVRNEHIHLDITERRIDRGPYEASLQVRIDRPVQVHVGVALSTPRIAVTLRGVRGDGLFHGDLTRLTRVIAAHHVAP